MFDRGYDRVPIYHLNEVLSIRAQELHAGVQQAGTHRRTSMKS